QAAVEHHLLSARARRLEWTPRIVQPHVHPLYEVAPDVDVVVLDENELVGETRAAHQLRDLLQHALARLIVRMRLPREYKLYRALGIVHHRRQVFYVRQNEIGSLVSGEAPGKTNRHRVPR